MWRCYITPPNAQPTYYRAVVIPLEYILPAHQYSRHITEQVVVPLKYILLANQSSLPFVLTLEQPRCDCVSNEYDQDRRIKPNGSCKRGTPTQQSTDLGSREYELRTFRRAIGLCNLQTKDCSNKTYSQCSLLWLFCCCGLPGPTSLQLSLRRLNPNVMH